MGIVETIVRSDNERRLQIYKRGDDGFGFTEDMKTVDLDGNPCWTPVWPAPHSICESVEIAKREAFAHIEWLRIQISN